MLTASSLWASSAFPSLKSAIPNGNAVVVDGQLWPGVGHLSRSGGGELNSFGEDFKEAGSSWTSALCQKDSDGDGRTNGDELGDPSCIWVPGAQPQRAENITNPGIYDQNGQAEYDEQVTGILGGPLWYDWHAFLMLISWIIVIPAGVIFPIVMKDNGTMQKAELKASSDESNTDDRQAPEDLKVSPPPTPWWFLLHRSFMLLGCALFIAGFVVALKFSISEHFQSRHAKLGLAVVVLGLLQLAWGLFRPHKPAAFENKSQLRKTWELIHPWLGRSCVVLALATAITGFTDKLAPIVGDEGAVAGIATVASIVGSWIGFIIAYKLLARWRQSKRPEVEVDSSSS